MPLSHPLRTGTASGSPSRSQGLLLAVLLLSSAPTAQEPDAPGLFLANCAPCHGENGDGHGTTKLDRPARSFRDGGFSYGNTPEALFRTITGGIPGTPMPGFDTSLSEAERRALANYVTTLGPARREVRTEETVLVVEDRPAVAFGLLGPISPRAEAHPRGLLIGTTSGLSFEYRIDDVRLLGIRQGEFVERTDWTGRGGTPLKPLGKVVYLNEGGNPPALFRSVHDGNAVPLIARFERSWIRNGHAGLAYRLFETRDDPPLLRVEEGVDGYGSRIGSGFRRHFILGEVREACRLAIEVPRTGDGEKLGTFFTVDPDGVYPARSWKIVRRPEGPVECVGAVLDGAFPEGVGGHLEFALPAGSTVHLYVVTVLVPEWNEEVRRGLREVPFP